MASVTIVIQTPKDTSKLVKPGGQEANNMKSLANLVNGLTAGALKGKVDLSASTADPVAASGTITLVTAVASNTVTIGKTVFTASASPSSNTATAVDFLVTGSDTVVAAALAAAINANALGVAPYAYATSALGVVTVTCRVPGVLGNQIALAKSGAPITVSATYLAGGLGGSGVLGGSGPTQISRV